MGRRQRLCAFSKSLAFVLTVCVGKAFVPSGSFGVDVSGTCRLLSHGPQRTHVYRLQAEKAAGENHVVSSIVKTPTPPVVSACGG